MRDRLRRGVLAVCAGIVLIPLAGCSGTDELFDITCADLGERPANLSADVTPATVMVLIDVPANDDATAERIADDLSSVLGSIIDEADDLELIGYASGGVGSGLTTIGCMESQEYVFVGGNERRQKADKEELTTQLRISIVSAIQSTEVSKTGDARALLNQVPVKADIDAQPQVVLWSTFLSPSTDCLADGPDENASAELATQIAQRCADGDLLPKLGTSALTIVGAGYSTTRPELATFGKALARELCQRMAEGCDIR